MKHNFASFCGIPNGQLRMLRWNGWAAERVFEDAEDGYQFEAAGAMKFDEESQSWRFGLQVKLGVLGWVFCGFGVTDSDGKALVEVARNRPRLVDLNDQNERAQLYDYIVDVIKTCYQEGTPRPAIGFSLPVVEISQHGNHARKGSSTYSPCYGLMGGRRSLCGSGFSISWWISR